MIKQTIACLLGFLFCNSLLAHNDTIPHFPWLVQPNSGEVIINGNQQFSIDLGITLLDSFLLQKK